VHQHGTGLGDAQNSASAPRPEVPPTGKHNKFTIKRMVRFQVTLVKIQSLNSQHLEDFMAIKSYNVQSQ